jgi:uncharacterized SAM-binding protein YcdF (DUF218 family)
MIFFLRKFIEALLLPIGLSAIFVIAGVIWRRRLLSLGGVALLFLFSTQIVGLSLLRQVEQIYPPKPVATAPNADAIVVLSGGIIRGVNAAGVQWGESSNRYLTALDLAMAGKAQRLVFSTAETDDLQGPSQGDLMRQAAIRAGIRPENILLTHHVLTTEDEAREASRLPGVHSILLVTSAAHMPRAVLLFRARGLEVSPFPTDQRALGHRFQNTLEFIPTSLGLKESEQALREYYGLAVYRLILAFRPLGNLR